MAIEVVLQGPGLHWEISLYPRKIEEAVVQVETERVPEMETENFELITSVDNGGGVIILDHVYTKPAASESAEETKPSQEQLEKQNKQLLNELRNDKLKNRSMQTK